MSDEPTEFLVFEDYPVSGTVPDVGSVLPPWRVLIIDDDVGVHTMTRLALDRLKFRDRGLQLLSAYSGAEALEILRRESDIALAFVDVVMETDDAGLELIRVIREEIDNQTIRLILRTGQPGQAPEPHVVVNYDINDYKSKIELTHRQLFSCTISALRAYEHLVALEAGRRDLRRIIEVTSELFQLRTLPAFSAGVLAELARMTGAKGGRLICIRTTPASTSLDATDVLVLATDSCRVAVTPGLRLSTLGDGIIAPRILESLRIGQSVYDDKAITLYLRTPDRRELVVYLDGVASLTREAKLLIEVFLNKVAVGIDTVYLWNNLRSAHQATVIALVDVAEGRDTDTGNHVLRIALLCERIARCLSARGYYRDQIDEVFLERIGTASMLHDVGKVAIPDRILLKPGSLDVDERTVMETHAVAGSQMLTKAAAMVDGDSYLHLGQKIALGHHEWYDGSGYPEGLSGQDIPLAARIVAVADVFDALCHQRPYKEPWPLHAALAHVRQQSGSHFDPLVVDALIEAIEADRK
ncbi:MAG: HD domain-containing phosphohydrolase [Rhodospirillaceae bacterium]